MKLCKEPGVKFMFPDQGFVPESTQILFAGIPVSPLSFYYFHFPVTLQSSQSLLSTWHTCNA